VPAYGDLPAVHFAPIGDGLKMASGQGLKNFARVVAGSTGYARCMVTRIVTQMYLKKAWSLPSMSVEDQAALKSQEAVIERLTNQLVQKRTLRDIFEDAAIEYLGN
jgi:hypothetical protein